ncbi:LOW QUALITY PROTEIN: killer cell immunoglobulin-like receptor 3DL1 [Acomys russatus]|uniref:LOW QUALITY PROTEIN: killer cell immunoglobulin-like receptor 3DL1 n=1 Tax=Acomys russatus TaxID=60746 RepID=UPI0021E29DAB|nr:LOW QUALITY PROTEIN: killer cell immunoglobulin-like receptor 3DL1 [Acomys russatus]
MMYVLLNLVCTESHDKPSLSAWPSHVVQLGQHVSLTCDSHSKHGMFKVYKEHGTPIPHVQDRTLQNSLVLGPVTSEYAGTYRCYEFNPQWSTQLSSHSDPLEIIISGIYRKPFLVARESVLLNSGSTVTLKCHSEILFEIFILTSHKYRIIKDSFNLSAESHLSESYAKFSIGPVTPDHVGTYTCYGSYHEMPYKWSDFSDPIDIRITGLYKKPSLSAQIGPVLMSRENVTLSCISDHRFDMFHLSLEGVSQGHGLPAMKSHNGTFQANFALGPVIQKGNYRCYGSFRNSSHVWSSPSDPLYLPAKGNCTSCTETHSKSNNHRNMYILIRLLVTLILVFVIILYFCCSAKKSKSQDQASESIMDQDPEAKRTLNGQDTDRQEGQEVHAHNLGRGSSNKN